MEDLTLGSEKGPVDTLLPEFNISSAGVCMWFSGWAVA